MIPNGIGGNEGMTLIPNSTQQYPQHHCGVAAESYQMFFMEPNKENPKNAAQGHFIIITCGCKNFSNYEMRNFIQDTIFAEVRDLSTCRDRSGEATGHILCYLSQDITISQLAPLHGKLFKGYPCSVSLYLTYAQFQHAINIICESKINKLKFPKKTKAPQVYILNFWGKKDELLKFLLDCVDDEIPELKEKETGKISYFVAIYSNKDNALKISRSLDGYEYQGSTLLVKLLYKSAAERSFCVKGVKDEDWIISEIEQFGPIEQIKKGRDGSMYFNMESVDSSISACTFINGMVKDNSRVKSFFVELEYFIKFV